MKRDQVRWMLLAVIALFVLANCGTRAPKKEGANLDGLPTVPQEIALGMAAGFKESANGFSVTKRSMFGHVSTEGALTATKAGAQHSLQLAPAVVSRGGAAFTERSRATLRGEKIVRALGSAEEVIESRPGEIEISWKFSARPSGAGDLAIELPLGAHGDVVPVSGALRFPREKMRISRATWIDAAGSRTEVAASFEQGSVRFLVPEKVVRDAVYPAVLDPTISPEHEIDPTSVTGLATQYNQLDSAAVSAAFDGTNYLVAWYDFRSYRPRIMAARVSQTGEVLDKAGIPVAEQDYSGIEFIQSPQALLVTHSKNGGYLIMWLEPQTGGIYSFPISAIRMKDDGTVVGSKISLGVYSAPLLLGETDTSFVILASSGFNGTTYRVALDASFISGAYQPESFHRAEEVLTLSLDGNTDLGRMISDGDTSSMIYIEPANGLPFNIVKKATFRNNALESLIALETTTDLPTSEFRAGRVGDNYYAMARNNDVTRVHLYRASDLAKTSELTLQELNSVHVTSGDATSITLFGSYHDLIGGGDKLRRCTYSPSFTLVGTCTELPNWDYLRPTFGTTSYLNLQVLTPSPTRGGQISLQLFKRADDTSIFGPALISNSVNAQRTPTVVYDSSASEYMAVWTDDRHGDDSSPTTQGIQVLGARISNTGAAIGDVIELSPLGNISQLSPTAVSIGPSRYFVAWAEVASNGGGRIVGRTVQTGAMANLGPPVVLTQNASFGVARLLSPTVSFDGTGIVVAWIERVGTGDPANQSDAVYAKRLPLNPTQANADAAATVGLSARADGKSRRTLTSTFDGKQTLFVWDEAALISSELYGAVLAAGAGVPDSLAFPVATAFGFKQLPRLATDGKTGSLLVWQEYTAIGGRAVHAKLLSREKVRPENTLSQIRVSQNMWDEGDPAVAFANDGESYFVSWSDRRDPKRAAIYGNWVTLDGRVLSPTETGELISGSPEGDEEVPFATTGPESTIGLVYNRYDGDPGRGALRAHFRTVRSGQLNGTNCAAPLDCASRLCVDGICCNSTCTDGCGTCAGPQAPNVAEGAMLGICSPYRVKTTCGAQNRTYCDGVSPVCKAVCTSNDDCALPSLCIQGKCSGTTATCADETHVATTTSDPVSCGNYRCREGACLTRCESVEQCAPGLVCTFENQCAAAPPVGGDSESACSSTSRPSIPSGAMIGIASAVALALRMRRRSSSHRNRRT